MAKKKEEPALNKAAVDKLTSLLTSMDKHLYGMVLRLSTIAENISSIQIDDKLKGASGKDEEKEKEKTDFEKVLQKLDDITGKFDKFAKSVLSGSKTLLGFGALALLFFDPQTLFSILSKTVLFVANMVDAINKFMNGDFVDGMIILFDNIKGVAITIGTIALLFGGKILRSIKAVVSMAESIWKAGNAVAAYFAEFGSNMSKIGSRILTIGNATKSLISKLALPVTIIMGIVGALEGAFIGYKEGGIMGAIKGALVGAFDMLIGGLLDMVKDGVSWILSWMGLENASAALDSFSFTGLFKDLVGAVFAPIEATVNWVKTMFTDPTAGLQQLWDFIVGGSLLDIIYSPIDLAVRWISSIFGWEDGESFSLRLFAINSVNAAWDWVSSIFTLPDFSELMGDRSIGQVFDDAWNGIIDWFTGVFDFLPSMEEIKSTLMSLLPSWLQPASVEELANELESEGGVTREEVLAAKSQAELEALASRADDNSYTYGYNEAMAAMEAMRVSLPQMRNGGIMNADPRGSLTMLHGTEAVIPLDSANARSMLENIKTSPMDQRRANYALNNMADMAGRKEKASITSLSAPTVVHNGGSNVTNITNVSNAGTSRYLRPQYELG